MPASPSAPELRPIDLAAVSEAFGRLSETFNRLGEAVSVAAQQIGRNLNTWLRDPETVAMMNTFTAVQIELRTDRVLPRIDIGIYEHAKSELGTDWLQ